MANITKNISFILWLRQSNRPLWCIAQRANAKERNDAPTRGWFARAFDLHNHGNFIACANGGTFYDVHENLTVEVLNELCSGEAITRTHENAPKTTPMKHAGQKSMRK